MDFYNNVSEVPDEIVERKQPAFYTSDSVIQFFIPEDKRYLMLEDTLFTFQIEVPIEYFVVDNGFPAKLFENMELTINYETITSKSSAADYAYDNFLYVKSNFDESYVFTTMNNIGYFDSLNHNAADIKALPNSLYRRQGKQVSRLEDGVNVTYNVYDCSLPISHGLFRQSKPLVAHVPVHITFNRADASKSLLQIKNSKTISETNSDGETIERNIDVFYPYKYVPIINPNLRLRYYTSRKWDEKLTKFNQYSIEYPFVDSTVRREVLNAGISDFNFIASTGNLPKTMYIMLTTPEVFNGDFSDSLTNFQRHSLSSIDLNIDSVRQPGFPLIVQNGFTTEYYTKFLETTNRFMNAYSSGCLSHKHFDHSNFFVVHSFSSTTEERGQVNIRLKFETDLVENLVVVVFSIRQSTMFVGKDLTISMK